MPGIAKGNTSLLLTEFIKLFFFSYYVVARDYQSWLLLLLLLLFFVLAKRRSANRPKFFPTLPSCSVGEASQARLHHTHSTVDLPAVFQGEG